MKVKSVLCTFNLFFTVYFLGTRNVKQLRQQHRIEEINNNSPAVRPTSYTELRKQQLLNNTEERRERSCEKSLIFIKLACGQFHEAVAAQSYPMKCHWFFVATENGLKAGT